MATATTPRLKERYETQVKQALLAELGLANAMQVPKLEKIVINMGVGKATQQPSLLEGAVADLTLISGQKPIVTKSRDSIASFKLRENQAIRLRQDRRPARHGHHHRHHGEDRRAGQGPPRRVRFPLQARQRGRSPLAQEGQGPRPGPRRQEEVGRKNMAKKSLINKANATPKYKVRAYTRCRKCGRARSVFRKFGLCRVCLREMAHAGEIPGVTKASW